MLFYLIFTLFTTPADININKIKGVKKCHFNVSLYFNEY